LVKNEEIKTEFDTFQEVWKFYKRWYGVTQYDGGDWQSVIKEANDINVKYGNSVLSKELLMSCIRDLERVSREFYKS